MQDLVLHDRSPEVGEALGSAARSAGAASGPAPDVQRAMSEINSQIAREIGAGDARVVVWCRRCGCERDWLIVFRVAPFL